MKIFVLGPLPDAKTSGGVAVFTRNLAIQLRKNGHEVILFSKKPRESVIEGIVEVRDLKYLRKSVNQERPQLAISSLWYSIYLIFYRSFKTVHLLHGFTNIRDYSKLKFFLMIIFDHFIRKNFDFILTNSNFTRLINESIFGIKIDGVFQIGLPVEEISRLRARTEDKRGVLYLGRLVRAKNVDKIENTFIHAFPDNNFTLDIVGYGSEIERVKSIANGFPNIHVLGAVENSNVFKYYCESKVFISLNPSEPFGITYLEALMANCFVIAPDTGGQVELLQSFPDRVRLVDIHNESEIVNALRYGMSCVLKDFISENNMDNFTYKKTVNNILEVISDEPQS